MGRNSGGVVDISKNSPNAIAVRKAASSSRAIHTIADRSVVKELQGGISRFHAVMGVKERSIRIADLTSMNALGVTYIGGEGKSTGILLNSKFFDRKRKSIEKDVLHGYDTGFKNRTNRPLQHTITHELAHATWNAHMSSTKAKAAGKEIMSLYKKWLKDDKKKGYGAYGRTNVSEFFAEGVTKAIHGNADKYTRSLKKIVSKYKL